MTATNTFYEHQLIEGISIKQRKISSKVVDTEVLLHLVRSKSERGFNILYDNYCGALYAVLIKMVRRSDISEDLLQDTFVKIWRYIETYDDTKGSLFTWMLNIAKNVAFDFLRSSSNRNEMLNVNVDFISCQNDFVGGLSIENTEFEFNDMKDNALQQLNPLCAEVIDMIFFYGCTHEQTAEILNLPLGTVKTRARKGLAILRTLYR
jgi:RNA polymerase sigma-70 factor, ECF subfamily